MTWPEVKLNYTTKYRGLTFVFDKSSTDGYYGFVVECPGAAAQAETKKELYKRLWAAKCAIEIVEARGSK